MNRKPSLLLFTLLHLCVSTISSPVFADTPNQKIKWAEKTQPEPPIIPPDTSPGYTINFDNVSIIEYIKFISKISGMNFIYDETDLTFNVTIVSEEPTKLVNVMSALIQVLRINGFDLIEQGNNLVISKTGAIKQLATVVSQEAPIEGNVIPPIMTRVFKVKNANPMILAGLVRPLLSDNAVVEVSEETRHLIITDITQNIEQIQRLFLSLDIPIPSLEIDAYRVLNNSPDTLVSLVTQILTPISEGNPLIFVAQDSTNSIFIVSTPFLTEKAIEILRDLDTPPSLTQRFSGPITGKNVLIYHIMNKPADILQSAIKQIESNLAQMGPASADITQTLNTMKFIRESHSLLFTGTEQSLAEVRSILEDLDTPYTQQELEYVRGGYFLYKIQYGDEAQIARALEKFLENLKKSPYMNKDLIDTIESMKWIKENDSLLFTGDQKSLDQIKKLLPSLDVPLNVGKKASKIPLSSDFYSYSPSNLTPQELLKQVQDYYKSLKESDLSDAAFMHALASAKIVPSSNAVVFTGDPASLAHIQELVMSMDKPSGIVEQEMHVYVYKIQYVDPEYVESSLQKLGKSVPSTDPLAQTIDNMKYIPESNTLVFRGPPSAINHIKLILPTLDNAETAKVEQEHKPTYLVYSLQNAPGNEVLKELEQTAKTIKPNTAANKELIESIKNVKWIESTNSLILTGTPPVIQHLEQIIAKFDIPRPEKQKSSSFYVYKPEGISAKEFLKRVNTAAKEMETAGLADNALIKTMESGTLVSNNTAVMFTGTPDGIEKLKAVLQTFDTYKEEQPKTSQFYIYKPNSISAEQLQKDFIAAAKQMEKSGLQDPELIDAMESAKAEKGRVLFTGTPDAIDKIKVMARIYDTEEGVEKNSEYYIFRPVNQSPQSVVEQAQHTAAEMKDSGYADPNVMKALQSASIVSKGTGVLFTGTPSAIAQIKTIAPTFDSESAPAVSQFFVYQPQHISADALREHARKVAIDMETSNFANQAVIQTLKTTRLVSNGKAVLFTGTPQSLLEVKNLLPTLDFAEGPVDVGQTTFVVYKIQHVSGPVLMGFLRNMANDFRSANSKQEDLITTLNNMRYVKDTNSLIFTGTPDAVQQAIALAKQFDIPELGQETPARAPSDFLIYKPKYVPGEELIKILHDFQLNLINSGVSNQGLFDTINNLKWMERTSSILVSGDEDDIQKTLKLLERFDVPGPGIPQGESGIETVSDMSFLIYKLQYHSGGEIQTAIKQIGDDLEKAKSAGNEDLVQAIKTLQWIDITNSLIATGKADALGKLKELIKSIDIPLKQVFVEVLVLETSIGNQLSFGLRWGSQGVYRNKFSYGTYMSQPNSQQNPDPLGGVFTSNLSQVTATNTPTGQFIPISDGMDLGIIGDIILHKGQTYLALGSLVDAVRADGDSTVVMNQKIITQDNKMSTFFTGQNIPYTGSVVTNTGQNTTVQNSNLEYRDVGVSLSITPTVGNNDIITLAIEEDISEQVQTEQGSDTNTGQVFGITTSKTTTKTVVSVPDKSFLALSGSIQDSTTHTRTSVPCLGGLPLIGAAFSQNDSNYSTSNIIIFIRPQIIKSFDTYAEITERQEDIFRSQANAEDFDAGLELVKTPDDSY